MDVRFTALPAAASVSDSDVTAYSQDISTTPISRKVTALLLSTYMKGKFSSTDPITYNTTTGVIGLNYNATNLRITSTALNTIQDIATTSSPTFGGVTVNALENIDFFRARPNSDVLPGQMVMQTVGNGGEGAVVWNGYWDNLNNINRYSTSKTTFSIINFAAGGSDFLALESYNGTTARDHFIVRLSDGNYIQFPQGFYSNEDSIVNNSSLTVNADVPLSFLRINGGASTAGNIVLQQNGSGSTGNILFNGFLDNSNAYNRYNTSKRAWRIFNRSDGANSQFALESWDGSTQRLHYYVDTTVGNYLQNNFGFIANATNPVDYIRLSPGSADAGNIVLQRLNPYNNGALLFNGYVDNTNTLNRFSTSDHCFYLNLNGVDGNNYFNFSSYDGSTARTHWQVNPPVGNYVQFPFGIYNDVSYTFNSTGDTELWRLRPNSDSLGGNLVIQTTRSGNVGNLFFNGSMSGATWSRFNTSKSSYRILNDTETTNDAFTISCFDGSIEKPFFYVDSANSYIPAFALGLNITPEVGTINGNANNFRLKGGAATAGNIVIQTRYGGGALNNAAAIIWNGYIDTSNNHQRYNTSNHSYYFYNDFSSNNIFHFGRYNGTTLTDLWTANTGVDDAITFVTGIYLPTSGGTPAILNYYETYSATISLSGIWAASQSVVIRLTRVGKAVNLYISGVLANANTAATISAAAASIPTSFLGSNDGTWGDFIRQQFTIRDNAVDKVGCIKINANGSFTISAGIGATTAFAGSGSSGFPEQGLSWSL